MSRLTLWTSTPRTSNCKKPLVPCRKGSTWITSGSTMESSSHTVISSSGFPMEMMESTLDVISHMLAVGSFRLHWRMTSTCASSPLTVLPKWRVLSRRSALSRLILDLSTA
uniref:DNA primase, putative n=1 Tax=Arundo donax TaxID=35708 RepID=A0A0A9BA99_ARUDO